MLGKILTALFIISTIIINAQSIHQRIILWDSPRVFWDYNPTSYSVTNAENAYLLTNYTKTRSSLDTLSKVPPILKIQIDRYETNFSNYDTSYVSSLYNQNAYMIDFRLFKYGSTINYTPVLDQINKINTITKTGTTNNYKVPDIGCLYDSNNYPLVDSNNNILYPNN